MKKKILYVSDLDGTLLRNDEKLSQFTNETINQLVEEGLLFSYATARSYRTAQKVTKGLNAKIPLIVYNGALIIDNVTGEIIKSNFFEESICEVLDALIQQDIYPIVYSFIDGVEKFSFIRKHCTKGMLEFIASRNDDQRMNEVYHTKELYQGNKFYLTCIGNKEKLKPFYDLYKDRYHVVFQDDFYTKQPWLEILPKEANKANAIQQVKAYLQCDAVVVFGDGKNDIDMFKLADEAYAVANAVDEIKMIATSIIESNEDDGVAKWLSRHGKGKEA